MAYVTYVGKYQKAYIRHHTFYLGIFLTVFCKLLLIIEWKINSEKANIEVWFKKQKILRLNAKTIFQKIYRLERVKLLMSSKVYFFKNLIQIYHISQKIWIFASSILTIFVNILDFFTFTCYKKKLMKSESVR